jgi:hypothetical protein
MTFGTADQYPLGGKALEHKGDLFSFTVNDNAHPCLTVTVRAETKIDALKAIRSALEGVGMRVSD